MPIIALIFVFLIVFTVVAIVLGTGGRPQLYWWAALSSYVCAFLSSFSIGLYILSLSFALLSLAVGHSFRWIRTLWHSVGAVAIGLALWLLAVLTIDDYVLFFPFRLLDPWLSS